MSDESRFHPFDEGELQELWEALAMYDGTVYIPDGEPERTLLREIEVAMRWRGVVPRNGWLFPEVTERP